MKKLTSIIVAFTALIFVSCDGPVGPPGIPGEDGEDGFIGTTFEFTDDFTSEYGYELVFNFQENGFEPYESDVILAYVLWKNEDGIDYWRPLPQTTYFESGAILQYNFDFTADIPNDRIIDMAVFLEGDIDLSTLPDSYTLSQTFRVVVVPSDFLALKSVDVSDLDAIMKSPNIEMKALDKVELKLPAVEIE